MESMLFAAVCAVVAVAVSWGLNQGKMEQHKEELKAHKDEMKALRDEMKSFVRVDSCVSSHKYGDKEIAEIKLDLREIKAMLTKLMDK